LREKEDTGQEAYGEEEAPWSRHRKKGESEVGEIS